MAFSPITHLRHFDIAVPDYQKQVEFYKNHWGLTEMENDGGVTYFAAEGSPGTVFGPRAQGRREAP